MKKKVWILMMFLAIQGAVVGCERQYESQASKSLQQTEGENMEIKKITLDTKITKLEDGLSAVRYEGDYSFDTFLNQGGASSDEAVVEYVKSQMISDIPDLLFSGNPFGCSTLSVKNIEEGYLFGRNFDWNSCNALIVSSYPAKGYASVSTVNTDFIQTGGLDISSLPDSAQAMIGLYAPLDGMNEKGLSVSVNMIEDSSTIEQNTEKPDITTTTAIRLLLDKAANVEEAVDLLRQYDLHASMGMMVHFALADADGKSVVVEYIDNEMVVTDSSVVTNFYLAEGEKFGAGSVQSHTRYEILQQAIANHEEMTEADIRDALDSVSKDNFTEFESTEWSIVMNQKTKELTYYHRENYKNGYTISIG